MQRSSIGRWRGLLLLLGLFLAACQRETTTAPAGQAPGFAGISLTIGALDNKAILTGVSPQRGEWQASRRGDVVVRDEPVTLSDLSSVDVVLFPAQRLGDLVNAGTLAPFPTRSCGRPGRRRRTRVAGPAKRAKARAAAGPRPRMTIRSTTWTLPRLFARM